MSMTKLSLIACLSAATISTAAWALQHNNLRAAAAPARALTAQSAPAIEIPTIATVVNTRQAPGSDVETIAVTGTHFSKTTTVRIVAPDGNVFTFGANSLEGRTTAQLSLTASLETPGTYFLMARNDTGTFSNAMKFVAVRR